MKTSRLRLAAAVLALFSFVAPAAAQHRVVGRLGAAFGAQFTHAGYNLIVSGLAPGEYQLAVHAHSTVTGTFNQSRVITIVVQP